MCSQYSLYDLRRASHQEGAIRFEEGQSDSIDLSRPCSLIILVFLSVWSFLTHLGGFLKFLVILGRSLLVVSVLAHLAHGCELASNRVNLHPGQLVLITNLSNFFSFQHSLRSLVWLIVVLLLGSPGPTGFLSGFRLVCIVLILLLLECYLSLCISL